MQQRRSVGAELALAAARLALPLGDRLAGLNAIDMFAGAIEGLRAGIGGPEH